MIIINNRQLVQVITRCTKVAIIILILHRSIATQFKELVSHQVISTNIHIIHYEELTTAVKHKLRLVGIPATMDMLLSRHCWFVLGYHEGITIVIVVKYYFLHGNAPLKLMIA